MDIVTLDFETFWASDYTLSKMSPLEYVMDPRFEVISVAVKVNDGAPEVHFGEAAVRAALETFDWSKNACLGHNMSAFDSYILAYRYGIRPRMWLCTLAMARPIHANDGVGLSLGALVKHYGLGEKDNRILLATRGRRLVDFTADEIDAMRVYNADDDNQCYALFQTLKPHYKSGELWQIDAIIRMRTEPQFELDFALLETALSIERDNKLKSLLALARQLNLSGCDWSDTAAVAEAVRKELASAPKFAALLESFGVPVPMKPSPTDETKLIPALAKTDAAFEALQDHDNEVVAAAARARLQVKSTLLETRIEKFQAAAHLAGGRLPIPIRYCGARVSGRDSGEEYNPQNMPRINKRRPKPSDALRLSLKAPEGHKIIVADQSGIELRTSHFLWKVPESMEMFQRNPTADLYRAFGATRYGCRPEEVTDEQRQPCKVAQLQLQFGAGPDSYIHAARTQAGLIIPRPEAEMTVQSWRAKYWHIVEGWGRCQQGLNHILHGRQVALDDWGLLKTCAEGLVLGGSGRPVRYPYLRYLDAAAVIQEFFGGRRPKNEDEVKSRTGWWYGVGRNKRRLYGAKAGQNGVQALARDSVFDASVDFYRQTWLRPSLRTHDELVYVVPEPKAQGLLDKLQKILRTPPKWWPELVVWSEGGIADVYGHAK